MLAAIPLSRSSAAQSFLSKQPARLTVAAEPPARVVAGRSFTIDLRLSPISGVHVKAEPAVFPPGEDLFFGPLKESVKVYSAPFAVKLPLSLDPKIVKAGETVVRGKVSYQACDDRVCFPPQSAPFEARLTVTRRRS